MKSIHKASAAPVGRASMGRYTITIKVLADMPEGQVQAIKEDVAMCLEMYEDVKILSVEVREPPPPEQLRMGGGI